jgi:leucyl aminopeptidase
MNFRSATDIDPAALDEIDALIVPVYADGAAPATLPGATRELAEWIAREMGPQRIFSATTHLRQGNGRALRLVVVAAGSGEEYDAERARNVVAAGVRSLWLSTARRLGVALDTARLSADAAARAAVEGVLLSMWRPEQHRTNEEERALPPLEDVLLVGAAVDASVIERGRVIGEAVNWTRQVSNEPGNLMTPTALAQAACRLAADAGLACEVIDAHEAARLGMNAFLSVARGSREPAKLVVMRHYGRGTAQRDGYDAAFVGKGITFDSGGISIKPAENMHLMKMDMAGAAAVVAGGAAVARLGLPLDLLIVAPCTENLPGGRATKPGDIVTSMSGKTVEVLNTDAEGRLVLLDGVTWAARQGARRIVDVATLTGAIMVALGSWYTGLFGRPAEFVDQVRRAGTDAGERLWPMPLSDEFRADMQSEVADLRNTVPGSRGGGASRGAAFIEAGAEDDVPWAHLDIASTAWLEHDGRFAPKGPTGSGVRTLVALADAIAHQVAE